MAECYFNSIRCQLQLNCHRELSVEQGRKDKKTKLSVPETLLLRWMYEVTRKERIGNCRRKINESHLRWFGHVLNRRGTALYKEITYCKYQNLEGEVQ